jgi:hypothetical protein
MSRRFFFIITLKIKIARCFSFLPAFSASLNQCGRLPRPDQVCSGLAGLRYFGATLPVPRRLPFTAVPLPPPNASSKLTPSAFSRAFTFSRTRVMRSFCNSCWRACAFWIRSLSWLWLRLLMSMAMGRAPVKGNERDVPGY